MSLEMLVDEKRALGGDKDLPTLRLLEALIERRKRKR